MVCVQSDEEKKGAVVCGGTAYAETCVEKRVAAQKNYMALVILFSGSSLYLSMYPCARKPKLFATDSLS